MAWNEPGGGRDQDPWGNRGRRPNDGPPDLDEALKQFKDKLSGMLGGNGGSGGSGRGGGAFILIAILAVGLWALSGIYFVEAGEKAMILQFGKYHDEVGPGAHWFPRFVQSYHKVDVESVNSYRQAATMLTKDQNIVDVEVTVQYQVSDPRKYFLQVADAIQALQFATESALRHVVGGSTMDSVITEGRAEVALEVGERLREYLQYYDAGLSIIKVNIEDSHPPDAVKAAFDDVTKAREEEEQKKNQADEYRMGKIPRARGMAERIRNEAEAYRKDVVADASGEIERFNKVLGEYKKAPVVTRQRLYLETLEGVYSRTPKVVVDGGDSNNLLYMPLDKLMGSAGSLMAEGAASSAASRSLPQHGAEARRLDAKVDGTRVQDLPRRSGWGER